MSTVEEIEADQVYDWSEEESEEYLRLWQHDHHSDYEVLIKELEDQYEVKPRDTGEIVDLMSPGFRFEDEDAALNYAADFMENFGPILTGRFKK